MTFVRKKVAVLCVLSCMFVGFKGLEAESYASDAVPQREMAEAMEGIDSDLKENKLLRALLSVEALADKHPFMAALSAQYLAIVGEQKLAEERFRSTAPNQKSIPHAQFVSLGPAVASIVKASKGTRVVIINEAHHVSLHRAFSHKLMLALRTEGYTHLAAEAFCATCDEVAAEGIPSISSGLYILDPLFGDMVRQSVNVGYQLVSYEMRPDQLERSYSSMDERTAARERAQARNLAQFLLKNPDAKILVHVGFGHVAEGKITNVEMFASELKRMTGINPLTIDQFEMTPSLLGEEFDPPLYRAFVERFGAPKSELVIENSVDQPLGSYPVDLSVVHPRITYMRGRPSWLEMGGYRVGKEVRFDSASETTLLRAFLKNEPDNAVPMDQVLVNAGETRVWFFLPEGEYRVIRQYRNGENEVVGKL